MTFFMMSELRAKRLPSPSPPPCVTPLEMRAMSGSAATCPLADTVMRALLADVFGARAGAAARTKPDEGRAAKKGEDAHLGLRVVAGRTLGRVRGIIEAAAGVSEERPSLV